MDPSESEGDWRNVHDFEYFYSTLEGVRPGSPDYDRKVIFWYRALCQLCLEDNSFTFSDYQLQEKFIRSYRSPRCLVSVINFLVSNGAIKKLEDPNRGIGGRILDSAVKMMDSVAGFPLSPNTPNTYFIPELLKIGSIRTSSNDNGTPSIGSANQSHLHDDSPRAMIYTDDPVTSPLPAPPGTFDRTNGRTGHQNNDFIGSNQVDGGTEATPDIDARRERLKLINSRLESSTQEIDRLTERSGNEAKVAFAAGDREKAKTLFSQRAQLAAQYKTETGKLTKAKAALKTLDDIETNLDEVDFCEYMEDLILNLHDEKKAIVNRIEQSYVKMDDAMEECEKLDASVVRSNRASRYEQDAEIELEKLMAEERERGRSRSPHRQRRASGRGPREPANPK